MASKRKSEESPRQDGVHQLEVVARTNESHPILDRAHHSGAKMSTVSVIICTRDRPVALRECLQHVSKLSPSADEVLVVDNSSGDGETEILAAEFGARYILEQSPGLSRARNAGLSGSRCDIVAFLDDDCVPAPEWLEYLLVPFSAPQVAAVTGEIIRYAGVRPEFSTNPCGWDEMCYVSRDTPGWFEMASFGGIGSGGNMAFRRSACAHFALFDKRLGRGAPFGIAEENYAFVMLLSRGHAAVRVPGARVAHPAKQHDTHNEATAAIAYAFLLFTEFPENRRDLIHFLVHRVFRRPVAWRPNSPNARGIVQSPWGSKLKAIASGVALYLRAKRHRATE